MLSEPHSTYKRPEPGFVALRPEGARGKLVRSYPSGVVLATTLDRELTLQEITVLNKKLDRIHEFYLGQSVAFLLKAKVILKDADDFNPGLAVKQLREVLVEANADLTRYATLNRVEQFELADEALYQSEVRRADEVLRRG